MKVKIKQLEPNPYRDMDNYPLNEEKLGALEESIKQTGFWDNIVARPNGNGTYQLAYGHHRLAILQRIFSPDDEVDIPIRELDDSTMIQIMANENMEEYRATPKVIDETIRVTKKFLEEHPQLIKTKKVTRYNPNLHEPGYATYVHSPLAYQIAEFLGWKESRVYQSLCRLNLIDEGKLDAESVHSITIEKHANEFASRVKKGNYTPEKQKGIAQKYNEEGGGRTALKEAFDEVDLEDIIIPEKEKPSYNFDDYIFKITDAGDAFIRMLEDYIKVCRQNEIVNDGANDAIQIKIDDIKISITKFEELKAESYES